MLDQKFVREHIDLVKKALAARGDQVDVSPFLELDARRRSIIGETESLKATRNKVSEEIARLKKEKSPEADAKVAEMRQVGDSIKAFDDELRQVEEKLTGLSLLLPNIPDPSIPVGLTEEDNVVIRTDGTPKTFDFTPKPHWELGENLGIIDFERGVKLSGTRFYVLNRAGAKLQRALIAWMLDIHVGQGYQEAYLPFMVKQQALLAAGQLPKFRDNLYHDAEEDFWMVPTAEVPLTNLHGGEILDAGQLPLRYCAYTPCFRREKMKAGSDVRGIKRGHQFDKVEMYTLCGPEGSDKELERMREDAEAVCKGLGLPYRVKRPRCEAPQPGSSLAAWMYGDRRQGRRGVLCWTPSWDCR